MSSLNYSEFIHDELRTTLSVENKEYEIINPGRKKHASKKTCSKFHGKNAPYKTGFICVFFFFLRRMSLFVFYCL